MMNSQGFKMNDRVVIAEKKIKNNASVLKINIPTK